MAVGADGWAEDILTESRAIRKSPGSENNKNNATAQPSVGNVNTPAPANDGDEDVNIVREFLREVGIPTETVNEVHFPELRVYFCGCLSM